MNLDEASLRSYYEEEARLGTRSALVGRRVEFRNQFIEFISKENRVSVVDFGAGPGGDGPSFSDAGYLYVGLDLALGNCLRAAQAGNAAIQCSLKAPPFLRGSFDAGWSMSTLMHLRESEVPQALVAMCETLKPGAPLWVGLWGVEHGQDPRDEISSDGIEGFQRLFSLRTFDRNEHLFSAVGTIETKATWPVGPDGWEYQTFSLRI